MNKKYKWNIVICGLLTPMLLSCRSFGWSEDLCRQIVITAEEATIWKGESVKTMEQFQEDVNKSAYVRSDLTYVLYHREGQWELTEQSVDISQGIHFVKDYTNISEADRKILFASIAPICGKNPTYKNRLFPPGGLAYNAPYALVIDTGRDRREYIQHDAKDPRFRNIFYTFRNITKKYGDVLPIANTVFLPEQKAK